MDAATIAEITEEADVGFGSFYNHFASKKEALDAAVDDAMKRHAEEVERLTATMSDPAEILAASVRHTVRLSERSALDATFVVRFGLRHRTLRAGLGARARRELRRGLKSGRFRVADPATALVAMGGSVVAVMQARLDGTLGVGAEFDLAEQALRMLGVPSEEARVIARQPLPGDLV
jgi:AcrR family transcriptional regulator